MQSLQVFQGVEVVIEGEVPLIRDTVLAEALGYTRPRKIRDLIARYLPFLPGIHCRPTVGRQSTGNGASREYAVNEYFLTEAHAIFIAAKSNTDLANQLLQKVIDAFLEAREFIRGLILKPLEVALRELSELRQMYPEDMARKDAEIAAARAAVPVSVAMPPPGQRTLLGVTNYEDTSDGKYLNELQREFGLPTKGKHSQLIRVLAQKLGDWNDPVMVYINPVDTRGGDTFRNPARKYKPAFVLARAHLIIRKARALGFTVPAATLKKYGDPAAVDSPQVVYENGMPTIHPVRPRNALVQLPLPSGEDPTNRPN